MEKEKIILDVDTGSDDAVAIVCALLSDETEVLGITTVTGNVEIRNTTDNTLRVVDCCGKQKERKTHLFGSDGTTERKAFRGKCKRQW